MKKPSFLSRKWKGLQRRCQFAYEALIAPCIAKYFAWLIWPVYLLLKRRGIVFVVNIAEGAGHTFFELDYFFRMSFLGDIDKDKKYVWVTRTNPFTEVCARLYRHLFHWAVSRTFIYNLFLPITMRYKDIILDCGCSRLKWQLPIGLPFPHFKPQAKATYLYQIPKNLGLEQVNHYYQRMQKSVGYYPMKPTAPPSEPLLNFLGKDRGKLALIHAKVLQRNATASPTDPSTYIDSILYLQQLGYKIIFIGREKMPELFNSYGVLNYAESSLISYENDIQLFHLADVMILSGSGLAVIPDCLDKFFLYLNSWHLAIPAFSGKSIHVPTLVKEKGGRFLTLREQNALYRTTEDQGDERFPEHSYEAKNASGEEILEALKELFALREKPIPLSSLQTKFRNLDPQSPLYFAHSRCSQFFLNKHKELV